MCQALTVPGTWDEAVCKNIKVPALKENRLVYMTYYCECGHPPILKCAS